ncbi:MAG: RNA methyltransferase [Sediminicola sp.]|tara:strand:+ start:35483 stop:36208 length:726 start_codon:yes stop_codon:yes gene_type:complete
MVVKSQIKLIKSLQQKKYRIQYGLFVAEGTKLVRELLGSRFELYAAYATQPDLLPQGNGIQQVSENELQKMSGLKTPNKVLAVFHLPKDGSPEKTDWCVALEDVGDPGNLGTIIRLCDWFGIPQLICSEHTADCYSPKTLQATMGSLARVSVRYTDLNTFLRETTLPIYGAFMDGSVVYGQSFPEKGVLVMGNEANGISKENEALVTARIGIPQFGAPTAESLNVGTATAILLNEIRRPKR